MTKRTEVTLEWETKSTVHERDTHTLRGVVEVMYLKGIITKRTKKKEVEAIIKRLIHAEKEDVYSRVDYLYRTQHERLNKVFIQVMKEKITLHKELKDADDDTVITW